MLWPRPGPGLHHDKPGPDGSTRARPGAAGARPVPAWEWPGRTGPRARDVRLATTRAVMVENPDATVAFTPQPRKIPPMIGPALTHLTGKTSLQEAWLSLISTQDTVGVKVLSAPGPTSGTRPAVVEAVVQSLLAAG